MHEVNSSRDPISATLGLQPEMGPIIILSSHCKVPLPQRVTMRARACEPLTGHHELVQDAHDGSDKDRSRAHSKANTVNSRPVTQITRKKETFIYKHGSPTGVHAACTDKMNPQVKAHVQCAGLSVLSSPPSPSRCLPSPAALPC